MATMVQCIQCKHGRYMQWMKNPIICECELSNERFVAEASRICPTYESSNKKPDIVHYTKYD